MSWVRMATFAAAFAAAAVGQADAGEGTALLRIEATQPFKLPTVRSEHYQFRIAMRVYAKGDEELSLVAVREGLAYGHT